MVATVKHSAVLWRQNTEARPTEPVAGILVVRPNGGLFFGGPNAMAAYDGKPVPLSTDPTWSVSNVTHLDGRTFTGPTKKMMNPGDDGDAGQHRIVDRAGVHPRTRQRVTTADHADLGKAAAHVAGRRLPASSRKPCGFRVRDSTICSS